MELFVKYCCGDYKFSARMVCVVCRMMTPFGFSLLDELRPDKEELVIDEDDTKYEIKMGTAGIKPENITVTLPILDKKYTVHCTKWPELKFKSVKYFLMQLNIKLYGTLSPLLLSIQLNFKPYVRMRLRNILYKI
jgi:hypothetical protein